MKKIYFFIFVFSCFFSFAQEQVQTGGEIDGFKLYPNPVTNGKVYVESDAGHSKEIMVYDVFGKQVLNLVLTGNEVDVSNLHKGIYILRAREEENMVTRKLVIK